MPRTDRGSEVGHPQRWTCPPDLNKIYLLASTARRSRCAQRLNYRFQLYKVDLAGEAGYAPRGTGYQLENLD